MKSRTKIAALAAACFAMFQGCDSSSLATASGDRSSEGKGQVGLRLKQRDVNILLNESNYLTYTISGPGMPYPINGSSIIDTSAIVIQGIPSGTRYVEVSAIDYFGTPIWYGTDTVEVDPGAFIQAKIKLTRIAKPKGNIILNLDIDSLSGFDSIPPRSPIDTTWRDSIEYSYWMGDTGRTYTWCKSPTWRGEDSLSVDCFRVHILPLPFPRDTLWFDSVVNYPVDSTPHCYVYPAGDSARTYCTRLVYRPYADTQWCDTTYRRPDGSYSTSRYICSQGFFEPPFDLPVDSTIWPPSDSTGRGNGRGHGRGHGRGGSSGI